MRVRPPHREKGARASEIASMPWSLVADVHPAAAEVMAVPAVDRPEPIAAVVVGVLVAVTVAVVAIIGIGARHRDACRGRVRPPPTIPIPAAAPPAAVPIPATPAVAAPAGRTPAAAPTAATPTAAPTAAMPAAAEAAEAAAVPKLGRGRLRRGDEGRAERQRSHRGDRSLGNHVTHFTLRRPAPKTGGRKLASCEIPSGAPLTLFSSYFGL